MLRFKATVRVIELRPELVLVLREATTWSLRIGNAVDVEVNSIDDAAAGRVATSLHGASLAVDLDTVGDRRADLVALANYMRRVLPAGYDLSFEGDHLHIEWDTHRAVYTIGKLPGLPRGQRA